MTDQNLKFTIQGEDKSKGAVQSFRKNIDGATGSLTSSIATVAKWGAAIVTAGAAAAGAAVHVAANFETKMTNVSTVLDTSVESMDDMRNQVMEIAQRTPVALDELATSLYDVRSAGISAEDAMMVLEKSAQLATAGLGTTKEAVDLSTSAINAFGLTGEEATEAFDIMMLTVKSGKTTVAELAQSFGQVAGVAKTAGVEFSELQAATAALTTTGLKASVAQSQLRAGILAIQAPTGDMAKLYKKMGVASGSALIKSKGLVGAMKEIKIAAKGDVEILKKAFGSVEALGAALSLTGEQGEAFKMILEDMQDPAGVLSEAFAKQQETFNASWQVMKNNLSIIMVKLGSVIMPMVASATKKMTKVFQDMMKRFEESGALEKFKETFAAIGEVVGFVIGDILVPGFKLAWEVTKGLASAIGELTAIFTGLFKAFRGSEVIQMAITLISDGFSGLSTEGATMSQAIQSTFKKVTEAVKVFADWFNTYVTPIIKGVVEAVIIVLGMLYAAWDNNFLGIKYITQAVFDGIKVIIEGALTVIKGILDVFVGLFTGDWERMGEGLKSIWQGVFDVITTIISTALVAILAIGESLWRGLKTIWEAGGEAISSWWTNYWNNLTEALSVIMATMGDLVSFGMDTIQSKWQNSWTSIKNFFVDIWNTIIDYLESKINAAITILNKLIEAINEIPGIKVPLISYVDINNNGTTGGRRAFGGSVVPDRSYLVGERGAEIFTPGTGGNITPISNTQQAPQITINISGNSIDSAERENSLADTIIEKLTRSAELKQLGY